MTPICHITHVANLSGMIAGGGLTCVGELRQRGAGGYRNIAYPHIQDRRAAKHVPCGPGGTLADYVPFYFAPRSPMLYTISRGNVEGYTEGQPPIVHLVAHAEEVVGQGLGFAFTDGHAVIEITDYFDDLADLSKIDWPLMRARYWFDTAEDGDRKRRRQAEFLVHRCMPWELVREIGVMTQAMVGQVQGLVEAAPHRPVVALRRGWYY